MRHGAGGLGQQALADEHGVNQTKVSDVVRRRTWRHVAAAQAQGGRLVPEWLSSVRGLPATTLVSLHPLANEPPATAFATLDVRNGRPCLDFDAATQETAVFSAVLPRHYGEGGITALLHWAATSATTGTVGWTVEFERVGNEQQDVDVDGFAAAQTVAAATVPATSGLVKVTSVAVANGAAIDSIAVGEPFRLRVRRDVANDTAAGDAELLAVELKET